MTAQRLSGVLAGNLEETMMVQPAITGQGVFTPPEVIANEELVAAYNAHAEAFNARHAAEIAAIEMAAKPPSSSGLIVGASGIERRHVMDRTGGLDPEGMVPDRGAP